MPNTILTEVRHAVWNAIDTGPGLDGAFARKYRFDDLPGRLAGNPSPSIGDLPALAIYPDQAVSNWRLNQAHEARYHLRFDLWTREWDLRTGERLWQLILQALHQNLTDPVVRPVDFTPLTPEFVSLGEGRSGPLATKWSFRVELFAGFWNPAHA